jgi:hypothetical protein
MATTPAMRRNNLARNFARKYLICIASPVSIPQSRHGL